MTIRVAAIEVNDWHSLYDAAYLRHLVAMPDVKLVAIQDFDTGLVARRAAEVESPPTFTDYRQMLATTRPEKAKQRRHVCRATNRIMFAVAGAARCSDRCRSHPACVHQAVAAR